MKKVTKRTISSAVDTVLFISAGFIVADVLQSSDITFTTIIKIVAIMTFAWLASAAVSSLLKLGDSNQH